VPRQPCLGCCLLTRELFLAGVRLVGPAGSGRAWRMQAEWDGDGLEPHCGGTTSAMSLFVQLVT
jgi:hypothetical protein